MTKSKKLIIFISVLALAVASGVFYLRNAKTRDVVSISSNPPPNPLPKGGGEGEGIISSPPLPDLTRPIKVTANLPEETKTQAVEKIKETSEALKKDPALYSHWVELGLYRKLIGDYEGAMIYWQYASVVRPKSFVPLQNLGDLYAYDFKNPKEAERYYLKALEADPKAIMLYEKLYELYRYFFKDDSKAKAILEEGISKNPDTSERLVYLLTNF